MPDDWTWFWAGEAGRDRLLREEIADLQGAAGSARSQAAGLSSRLANLQGSIETRLDALANAFDAYVELGDVRDQLAGYPDTTAVRRNAAAAIAALARGATPEPLQHEGLGYWVTYAVNAVIAQAAGWPDSDLEAQAVALDRDAELFVVAACGGLGHGAAVGDRVPALLVCDGALSPVQEALWRAVRAGEFGDILPAVREVWEPLLEQDSANVRSWLGSAGRSTSPLGMLGWLDNELSDANNSDRAAAGAEPELARAGLLALAGALVQRGLGDEVVLLDRARTLRARIENPGVNGSVRGSAVLEEGEGSQRPDVTDVVRAAYLEAPAGSDLRSELGEWIRPGLLAAIADLESAAQNAPASSVQAKTPAGAVDVDPRGVDPQRLDQADQRLVAHYAVSLRPVIVPGVILAALLLVLLVSLVVGSRALAVLAVIAAIVPILLVVSALRSRRLAQRALAEARATTRDSIAAAVVEARELETQRSEIAAESAKLAASLREQLAVDQRIG